MSDNNLQRFIKHSIIRKSTNMLGEKQFSKECLCYLLSYLDRFKIFLFYQKQIKKTLCKDILRHIYSFYGNHKINLPEGAYNYRDLYTYWHLGNLYFHDIKLTIKILENTKISNQQSICITYCNSYYTETIPLIAAILTRIEKGVDIEENKKIISISQKHTKTFQIWIQKRNIFL